ncbi:RWD domain-containing protein 4 [Lepeophtheirus salmonis]|uniref:CG10343 CG10343PAlike [Tribolium castaneum] n=1 Tax=Lepeophtheirus salmonis TaxID=72036 RepID=A0A0K2UG93_LEPSM|nr:RWD domain-containing protein 4-like [Lepeophtheirus salmonis]
MGETSELQSEELEVLKSIYEGDLQFKVISDTKFQYKYGEDGSNRSFLLEIGWPEEYPNDAPDLSMDTFYNAHLKSTVSQAVIESVEAEIPQYLGMSMTYSLFEHVKENYDELVAEQPEVEEISDSVQSLDIGENTSATEDKKVILKKEKLTKAQKRRMWNKGGIDEHDRPRGWNWVDVIRHLSQTGYKEDDATA